MLEADFPFHIKVNKDEKNFDIQSIGHDNFGGELTHNVSAHPKVNRKTGELYAFGYDVENALFHFTLFNKERKAISGMKIPLSSPRMIHDFAITENHIIIPDLALEMRPDLTIKEGGFIFKYNGNVPARYGIMKKLNQNVDQIQWFELPSHYVFHFVNAWEETNEKGETIIKLFGCI
jgi:9-cis-epoxycarotenoid dioxygenase